MAQQKSTGTASTSEAPGVERPMPDKIICACANLDFAKLQEAVAQLSHDSFDALLARTGAGKTCTACLLDLEYYFVELKAGFDSPSGLRHGVGEKPRQRQSLKQRIYGWLDSISPPIPWSPDNWIPIIAGRGIETWLNVTNHDLLFRDRMTAPLQTTVTLWSGEGMRLTQRRLRIQPGEEARVRLDEEISRGSPVSKSIVVGSARIVTKAEFPAMRGTMRPQFEIVAPAGACAVHVHGVTGPGDTWFTVQNRRGDERLFLAIINAAGSRQSIEVAMPLGPASVDDSSAERVRLMLAPHGAALQEVLLSDAAARAVGSTPFGIRIRCERAHKVFLLCATRSLDRFSVDHP